MKMILLVIAFFATSNQFITQESLTEIRQLYLASVESSARSNEFMNYMNSINHQDALLHAYYASALALQSKHISGPSNKLKYLKLADKCFEESIQKNSHNAEIRFLRFSVQCNLPVFLGYSNDIEDDLKQMILNISNTRSIQDYPQWKTTIIKYIINSGKCTNEQLMIFKSMLN
jgi:hypothetical protein